MPNIHLRNNYQKAVVCMVLAYISIALMGVFVKYASDELPSSEILFSRFFIGFVFLLPFLIKDGDFKVDMSQWKFLVLRNLAGIASMLLTFYAIKYLPISIAVLLMNTSSLFVPLLLFFFKVRTPLKVLACSFMGFIGVSIIMLTNGSMNINPLHAGYALGAAVLAAMAFISLQELNKHNSPKNIVFYFHLLGSFLSHNGKYQHCMDLLYYFWWADSVLFSNYYSLAPLNTRLQMSSRLFPLPVSFSPASVTGSSGITYQA